MCASKECRRGTKNDFGGWDMRTGNIIKLFRDKEYGSIKTKGGEDAHFHKLCLWDIPFEDLTEGQEVEFEIQSSNKGFLAFHIRPYIKSVLL